MNYEALIKTYALNYDPHTHYEEINNLIKQNLDQDSLPFNNDTPFPLDTNVITGKHFCDINQQKIELKACSIGSNNLLWIYGADAQYLGLELKSSNPKELQEAIQNNKNFNCKPVIVQSSIRERLYTGKAMNSKSQVVSEGLCVDCQCAYLLSQFTESSIQKVFSSNSLNRKLDDLSSPVKNRSSIISKQILKNIAEYNSGEKEMEKCKMIKKNFTLNLTKNTPGFIEAKKKYIEIMKNYTSEQKLIFDYYHKHFKEQLQKDKKYLISNEEKKNINIVFSNLLTKIDERKEDPSIIARTIFDAYTFTERLSHLNFSLEPVYLEEEEKQKKLQLDKFSHSNSDKDSIPFTSILNEKNKKTLHSSGYGIKKEEINEERGR